MENQLYPCLWFNQKAREAATTYCDLLPDSKILQDTPMVVTFSLAGRKLMGINGGPKFTPNAATSFYVTFEKEDELRKMWESLAKEGQVLMPLDSYPWSGLYGWLADAYGINWQLALGSITDAGGQVIPLLMFCGEAQGKAEQAIAFYTSVFKHASVDFMAKYEPEQAQTDATVVHAQFRIEDNVYKAMDSAVAQPFTFNEAISQIIECDTQNEIDYYWNAFTKEGKEGQCGWCQDQFGVWWQVVPRVLGQLMSDPAKANKVMEAFMKMKKFDIAKLQKAAE